MTEPTIESGFDDDELDLGQDETPVELTLEQQLSRLNLRELQKEAKDRGLSGAGRAPELIARITAWEENGGVILDPAMEVSGIKPGIAPAPVEPTTVPAPMPPVAGDQPVSASAPAAGASKTPVRQRVGFFAETNTFRVETPVGGPLGSTEPPDDASHFRLLEQAHQEARAAGCVTKGYPHAGKRIGFSSIQIPGQGRMRTVIYEVFAREEE